MQYIKTEGLLIDTVEKKASILGNPNETISNSSTTFLNGNNNITEDSSVSFLNDNTKTGKSSLSISSTNSTVSAKSYSFNTENSTVSSNSISFNDSSSQITNNSIGFLNQNEQTKDSVSVLSRSSINLLSSINIFSVANQIKNNSLSINSSNGLLDNKAISINSSNSSLTSSLFYNTNNAKGLNSIGLNTNNSDLNTAFSLFGNNNVLNDSFSTFSNNITAKDNSIIFNSFNNIISSNSVQIIGNNNFVDKNSLSLLGNTNFITTSSINIGSSDNELYNNSLNINGYNNLLSSNSLSLNSTNSNFIDGSIGIDVVNSQLNNDSLSLKSKNVNLELSAVDILGNNNVVKNNSISINSNNSNISNNSIVLNGRTNVVDDNSVVISSNTSNAFNKSLVIGGNSNTADLSSVLIGSIETSLSGNNSHVFGGIKNNFNSSNSVFLGGNNNTSSQAPNNLNTGDQSILIGGSLNKIGSKSIIIGGIENETQGKTIVLGGSGNKTNGFDGVVIINRNDVFANQGDIVYLPEINSLGNLTVTGNISAGGNITSINTLTANVSSLNLVNYLYDLVPLTVNQYKTTVPHSVRLSYNDFPRLAVNNSGVTINSFSVADNQALTVVGNVSTTGIVQVNNRIQFGSDSSVRLFRSTLIPNAIQTFGNLVIGSIGNGVNDLVLTQNNGLVQSRTINPLIWDTNAKFLSGSGGVLTNNALVKSNGTNNTLLNSNITDNGSSIVLGVNTIANNDLTVNGNSILGSDANDTLTINAGPINIPNATAHTDAIIIGSDSRIIRSSTVTLSTNASFILGGLVNNSTSNSVIVENNGRLEKRLLNSTGFNTTAPYISATSSNSFLLNRVLKAANSSGVTNSIITDDGTRVGINTTTPNQTLTIVGNLSTFGTGVIEASSSSNAFRITQNGSGNAFVVEDTSNDSSAFTITSGGFVGIGTSLIPERLVVDGNVSVSNALSSNEIITTGTAKIGTIQTNSQGTSFVVHTNGLLQQRTLNNSATNTTSNFVSATNTLTTNFLTKGSNSNGISPSIVFDNGTNVGIGTNAPTQKLTIVGTGNTSNILLSGTRTNALLTNFQGDEFIFSPDASDWGTSLRMSSLSAVSPKTPSVVAIWANSKVVAVARGNESTARFDVQGRLRINTLESGNTNSVLTHDSNITESRNINPIVWNTSASLISAAPTVNNNALTKFTGPNTIQNASIADSGSLVTFTTPVRLINGSSTSVALQFNAVNNTGLYFDSTNGLITNIAGQEKFRIDSDFVYTPTKLGIGTTSFGSETFKVAGASVLQGNAYLQAEPVITSQNLRLNSSILRQDGTNFYILKGASSTAPGNDWNTDRPLTIQNSTGNIYFANSKCYITHDDGIIYTNDGGATGQRVATRNYVDTKQYGVVKRVVYKPDLRQMTFSFHPSVVSNWKNVLTEPLTNYANLMGPAGTKVTGTVVSTGTNILRGVGTDLNIFTYTVASNNTWVHFNISFQYAWYNAHNIGHFRFYINGAEVDILEISGNTHQETRVNYEYWHNNSSNAGTNITWELRGRAYGNQWRPTLHYASYWDGQSSAAGQRYAGPTISITEYKQ
jgi:hypothetical protein